MTSGIHPIYGRFEPGRSPFRTKGTSYIGLVTRFDRDLPGGFPSVLERIEDPKAAAFLGQSFLASSTYDILPLLDAGQVGARLGGKIYRSFVREGAAYQADRDMSGVYRMLLRIATPGLVVERIPRVLMQYLDFGKMTGALTDEYRYEGMLTGIPKPVCPWIHSVLEGFTPVVMAKAGASATTVMVRPFEAEGSVDDMPIMKARVTVSWTPVSSGA